VSVNHQYNKVFLVLPEDLQRS